MQKNLPELKRVLLVEVAGSHDECLYTQINALREANVDLKLALDEGVSNRLISDTPKVIVRKHGDSNRDIVRAISAVISDYDPDTVVFNTAQGSIVRDLSLKFLFKKVRFVGIIHTTRKFKGSFTQRLINLKCREYLFLSQFLRKDVGDKPGFRLDYFYSLDFPYVTERKLNFPNKRVVVIGGVEKRRKDLDGFINMIHADAMLSYQFVFLGKSDSTKEEVQNFKATLEKGGLKDRVVLFEQFVSHEEFAAELSKADFILPLIHPDTPSADQYFKNQIPGAMNVSLAWTIPMLIHEEYRSISELNNAAFYYNLSTFESTLAEIDSSIYQNKVEEMKKLSAYQSDTQHERFMRFLHRENIDE